MKKFLIPLTFFVSVNSVNVFAEEPMFNVDDITTYHLLKVETTDDKNANKILKDYHSGFVKRVKSINKEIDNYKKKSIKSVEADIALGTKYFTEDQKTFDTNCKSPKTEKEHKSCQDFKEQIFNMTEKVKGLEIEKQNIIGELETARKNQLKKLYNDYKNMTDKIKIQVKNTDLK